MGVVLMSNQSGYVYLLKNDAMSDIYKIGMTNRTVEERVKELSLSTSIPLPFEVVCSVKVDDAKEIEQYFHKEYKEFRISNNREFFKFDKITLKDVISQFVFFTYKKMNESYKEFTETITSMKIKNRSEKVIWFADQLGYGLYNSSCGGVNNGQLLSMLEISLNNNGDVIVPIYSYNLGKIEDYMKILKEYIEPQVLKDFIENSSVKNKYNMEGLLYE